MTNYFIAYKLYAIFIYQICKFRKKICKLIPITKFDIILKVLGPLMKVKYEGLWVLFVSGQIICVQGHIIMFWNNNDDHVYINYNL